MYAWRTLKYGEACPANYLVGDFGSDDEEKFTEARRGGGGGAGERGARALFIFTHIHIDRVLMSQLILFISFQSLMMTHSIKPWPT